MFRNSHLPEDTPEMMSAGAVAVMIFLSQKVITAVISDPQIAQMATLFVAAALLYDMLLFESYLKK